LDCALYVYIKHLELKIVPYASPATHRSDLAAVGEPVCDFPSSFRWLKLDMLAMMRWNAPNLDSVSLYRFFSRADEREMLTTLHMPYKPIDDFTQPLPCVGRCNQEAGQSDDNSDDPDTYANKREYILF
jgi:hypothetical protein